MAVSGSPSRRVFVGNIPYDATEEQLIQICEEVGPVVSFRLVLDRETAEPKGYGFCEYRDEETALSALHNLQGYEMNGRRLRVNFAGNDRPQAGAPIHRDSSLHQPLGLPVAANTASLMANSLSAVPNSVQNMSTHQLYERLSEIKTIATQNKDVARQLLQGHPQLYERLEGGAHFLMSNSSSGISSHSTQSISTGFVPGSQTTNADSWQHSEKQVPQIPRDVESALLQQVMNLKPEQLGSLPLEQQQQVLQLQQMLTLKQKVISVV